MAPVFRNPFRPTIDPLGIEMSGHGDGWIGTLSKPSPGHSSPSRNLSEYTVVLDGLTENRAYEFAWAFHVNIKSHIEFHWQGRLHQLCKALCIESLQGRSFHRASEYQSELHCEPKRRWRDPKKLLGALKEAEIFEDLAEFAYESPRVQPNGSTALEAHMHRVRVLKIYEDSFRGEHSRGVRDYKLSRVKWLTVHRINYPRLPTQVLKLSLSPVAPKLGANLLVTRSGTFGANGEFLPRGGKISRDWIADELSKH